MKKLINILVDVAVEQVKSNAVLNNYAKAEAWEATAKEINERTGGSTTAKGAEMLAIRHKNIQARFEIHYNMQIAVLASMQCEENLKQLEEQ